MDHIKRNKIWVSWLTCILVFTSCNAQPSTNKKESSSKKEGIECCVEELLKTTGKLDAVPNLIKGSKNYNANGNSIKINTNLLALNGRDLITADSIKEWLQVINMDSIKVYSLNFNSQNYFIILCPEIYGATGLASNFYNWILININTSSIIGLGLKSLSEDNRMFYFKDGVFYVVLFSFGDDFYFKERDWTNPPIKVITYKIQDNALKKVSQIDTFCKCQ